MNIHNESHYEKERLILIFHSTLLPSLSTATTVVNEGEKTGPARKASNVENVRILAVKSFMVATAGSVVVLCTSLGRSAKITYTLK